MSKPRRRGSDADLKAIAARSEQHAMDLVVQRYSQRLQWHALCIVKDRQEAADAVQDVFIKAMKERRFWQEEFEIRAWLFRVTTNLCYNIVRDKKRRSGILAAAPRIGNLPKIGAASIGDTLKSVLPSIVYGAGAPRNRKKHETVPRIP